MAVAFRLSRSWASMNSRQSSHREVATGVGAGGQGGGPGSTPKFTIEPSCAAPTPDHKADRNTLDVRDVVICQAEKLQGSFLSWLTNIAARAMAAAVLGPSGSRTMSPVKPSAPKASAAKKQWFSDATHSTPLPRGGPRAQESCSASSCRNRWVRIAWGYPSGSRATALCPSQHTGSLVRHCVLARVSHSGQFKLCVRDGEFFLPAEDVKQQRHALG